MSDKEELIAWEMLECMMCEPPESSRGNSRLIEYALFRANYAEANGLVADKLAEYRKLDAQ